MSLSNVFCRRTFGKLYTNGLSLRRLHPTLPSCSYSSAGDKQSRIPQIAVSKDGETVMCWHPEPSFPYGHTKAIERNEAELQQGESVLRVQVQEAELTKYRPDGPTNQELTKMFYTTKHRWFPRPQRRFRKTDTPQDRDSI